MRRRRWSDLTTRQRGAVVAAGTVQVAMAAAAWGDLARRPTSEVNGPKPLWAALISVSFLGPALYFARGRRGTGRDRGPTVG